MENAFQPARPRELPRLDQWSPGVAGEAHFSLLLAGDRLVNLQALKIDAADLSLSASGRFAPDGESLAEITLDNLAFGGTAVTGVRVVPNGPQPTAYDVQIAGGVIDAEPFMDQNGNGEERNLDHDADPVIRLRTWLQRCESV